jgi:hypothetical protein
MSDTGNWSFLKLPDTAPSDARERAKMADEQAINRILNAVGAQFGPPELDKAALCADIADAQYGDLYAFEILDLPKVRCELQHLARVRGTANKLLSLLESHHRVDAMIADQLRRLTPRLNPYAITLARRPIDQLRRLLLAIERVGLGLANADQERRTAHKSDPILRGRRPSEKEWLAGVSLPLVFELHFRPARLARTSDGKPTGPTVRFISAALKELSLPYADESIAKAITRLKPLRQKQRIRNARPALTAPQKRAD